MASEEDLGYFEVRAVEGPVKDIISALSAKYTHPALQSLKVSPVSFSSVSYTILPKNETGEITSEGIQGESRRIPDRLCITQAPEGKRTIAFIVEYKAAHKVPVEDLRKAFTKKGLFTRPLSKQGLQPRVLQLRAKQINWSQGS